MTPDDPRGEIETLAKVEDTQPAEPRRQYAAAPLSREGGELRVMLVTSRETKRWVIPKGWPIKGKKPHEVAAREAYEEAGLVGEVADTPLGTYTYEKRLKNRDTVTCLVEVFRLDVRKRLKRWPEKKEREGRWFALDEAAEAVAEADLAALLRELATSQEDPPAPV